MNVYCQLKTFDQLKTADCVKKQIELKSIPSVNESIGIDFKKGQSNNVEKYKIVQRVLTYPEYKGEYFGRHKPHFICRLETIEGKSNHQELFLFGYVNGENPIEREKLAKQNKFTLIIEDGNPHSYVLAVEPINTDIIEVHGHYLKVKSVLHEEKDITITVGEFAETNIPIF